MSIASCCLKGFEWNGTPTGKTGRVAGVDNDTYIAGDETTDAAVLLIADLFGWTFNNIRLLADHYAREAGVTVYAPDFFGGEVIPADLLVNEEFDKCDLPGFLQRNGREARENEIFAFAKALRAKYKKVGAIGFCYGGWAVYRLGAKEHQPPLVDCISAGHPSLLIKKDIDEVAVPVQMLAPEIDFMYTAELKSHTFETLLKSNLTFDYQHYPGVEHACFVRGNDKKPGELEAMVKGKEAAVYWMKRFLQVD
ncbi:esterase/lipase [Exophiala aquamarina CBS 119918]|uniref:Esterase/lipase n=1 Tax=Exophiala aquamarina CBS 119918 TaxID=1182545 RepID=A0A072PSR5_9EURO|nr:esterase/lipase [Exophiala aquamarina CBS 119918]KEF62921.1 esterase/lipase [Exophiala aquamarina CBS 119918]